jgi:hypothetical protein
MNHQQYPEIGIVLVEQCFYTEKLKKGYSVSEKIR